MGSFFLPTFVVYKSKQVMQFKKIKGTVSGFINGKRVVKIVKVGSGWNKWHVMQGSDDTFFETMKYADTLDYAKSLTEDLKF